MCKKKLLLSSAIALALGTSGAAFAVVDIDGPSGVRTFAVETLDTTNAGVPADGFINDTATTNLDLTGTLGWSVGAAGAPRFMRFDFYNTRLQTPLTAGDLTLTVDSGASYSVSLAGGGGINDTFVIFEVTNTDGSDNIDFSDTFALDIGSVVATTKGGNEVRYRAFETGLIAQNALPLDPVNPNETFKDQRSPWFSWATGKLVACSFTPGEDGLIDTIDRAFWDDLPFLPGVEKAIARPTATALNNAPGGILNPVTGSQVNFDEYFAQNNATFWFERVPGTDGGFQGISTIRLLDDGTPGTNADVNFTPNWPTPLPFNPTAFRGPYVGFNSFGYSNASLFITNTTDRNGDGVADEMIPSSYQIRFAQPANAFANTATFRVPDAVAACGQTLASGSSDRLDFTAAADGTGVTRTFFRIVNPSDRDGAVVMRLINDAGDATPFFAIDNVDGIDSDVLAAGESTALISIGDAFAYAGGAYGFDIAAPTSSAVRNKLRVEVRGAFGEDAYDGNIKVDLPGLTGTTPGGPSITGAVRIRGQETLNRNVQGIQIQGFNVTAGQVIPFND